MSIISIRRQTCNNAYDKYQVIVSPRTFLHSLNNQTNSLKSNIEGDRKGEKEQISTL